MSALSEKGSQRVEAVVNVYVALAMWGAKGHGRGLFARLDPYWKLRHFTREIGLFKSSYMRPLSIETPTPQVCDRSQMGVGFSRVISGRASKVP